MSFEIWQIISVKKSLHMGAYQAARYIASYPHELRKGKNVTVATKAASLIEQTLVTNPLLVERIDDVDVRITPLPWEKGCGAEFEVSVSLLWYVDMPFLERVWRGTLKSSYADRIRCRD
jgi:hypothetical protein